MTQKPLQSVFLTTLLLITASPLTTSARHNNNYDGVNRSSLDNDEVEEIPVPILFTPVAKNIVADFGDPRGDGTRTHEGQDMFAPKGTPIVSPTEAIVIRTGTGESAGKYIYTANPGGETFRYMHLDDVANLDRGDKLDPGDYLGTVGDTGNAPDGVYHLHFEIRDKDNDALDPYPRLTKNFTLKESIAALHDVFRKRRDDSTYAKFLVVTYRDELADALKAGYAMPKPLATALKNAGVTNAVATESSLKTLLASVPKLLATDLKEGDQGPQVMLLQLYLMYHAEGEAISQLKAAGPTGFYGPRTTATVVELQTTLKVEETGVYDAATRVKLQ
jgi:peptidoglycan LD-endopeptidase LytH